MAAGALEKCRRREMRLSWCRLGAFVGSLPDVGVEATALVGIIGVNVLDIDSADGSSKNLTDMTLTATMKLGYNADSSNTISFITAITDANNGIGLLQLTNTQTGSLKPKKRYVYDVELSFVDDSANTLVERLLEGSIYINPSVTT